MIVIRAERRVDRAAVRRVNELAFGGPAEAAIVDALRGIAEPQLSLVAEVDDRVAGHIFFSPVSVESEGSRFTAVALGPMAVEPESQNRGIGSRLVRQGLEECRRIGEPIVFVVGHPDYYPRFGFSPAKGKGLRCEYQVPDEAFMVAELRPGALRGRQGLVRYRPEFGST